MTDSETLAKMVAQYIETALWAGLDHDEGAPLDERYGPEDLADETRALIDADLLTFAHRAWPIAEAAGWTPEQFAHDYYLTRNGHGAGFWDRLQSGDSVLGVGVRLTKAAESMGESDLYPGDDGKLYT